MRPLWYVTGFTSLGLGLVGLALPVVPTVPFLLLASFAFARSSPRWQSWLHSHPRLGPPIKDWERHGAISTRIKWLTTIMLLGSAAIGYQILPAWAFALEVIVFLCVLSFVLTRPAPPADL